MKFKGIDYYNIEELYTEEEKTTKKMVREFAENEVEPLVKDAFHKEEPLVTKKLARKLGELGLIGSVIPIEYGGGGTSYLTYGLISQELERVDSAVSGFIREQTALIMYPLWQYGSEKQKQKWLPKIARGSIKGCFGLTEPNHGSDISSIETGAVKDGNQWIINGSKQWISEGGSADFAIVWARTDEGMRGFIIEKGTSGFSQSYIHFKGSMRASDVGDLSLTDCRVPLDNVLPNTKGLKSVLCCLDEARFAISWGALGIAMDCYEKALDYTKERKQFGAPIASYQLVQQKLVNMLTEITKAQLLAYRIAILKGSGKANYAQISLAKKNNIAVARTCAAIARDILGANGISLELSPIRHMANIESVYTYQGTDDIHTLIIGSDITGMPAFRK